MTAEPRSYPQPHEGITGTLRDADDLLSLDKKAAPRRLLLARLAAQAYGLSLYPQHSELFNRMRSPQPGDLVVEVWSIQLSKNPDTLLKAMGILIERRTEWAATDEEYAEMCAEYPEEASGPRLTDGAWYIQYGPQPEDVCRWTNCEFITVPGGEASRG